MAIRDPSFGNASSTLGGLKNPAYPTVVRTASMGVISLASEGIYVGPSEPSTPVTFEQWSRGVPGFWGWILTT